jgi:phosphinothricin acetyltransferase
MEYKAAIPQGFELRAAGIADLEGILGIYNDAILTTTATFDTEEKSLAERRIWFEAHDASHPVLVVSRGKETAAWGSLSRWSDKRAYDTTAEVSVYVAREYRSLGLGSLLLARLLQAAGTAGLHMLLSRIAEGNEASLAMHRRFGFRHVGTLKEAGRKFGRFIDVEIFERPVVAP